MAMLPLFPMEDELPPQAARLGPKLRALAEQGIYFGTSSWKYEGWLGQIYSPERYLVRGKFSRKKFETECLNEYASTFPVVGGDFSFYQFPTPDYWQRLFRSAAPLQFGLKVPEDITVPIWPGHARYGKKAGLNNEAFLNAQLFEEFFAKPLEPYRNRVAVMMFEFGTFAKKVSPKPADFLARLDGFLSALPSGFRYSVEIRNQEYLGPEYFSLLSTHNTAHVFNAWTRMPDIGAQIVLPGAFTADFTVVRALLRRGRSYEDAVKQFSPYKAIQEPNPSAREAMAQVIQHAHSRKAPAFLFVNNRLEGFAPGTIEAVVSAVAP
jgi:uncharacterized protein YecE (DUF72 family)